MEPNLHIRRCKHELHPYPSKYTDTHVRMYNYTINMIYINIYTNRFIHNLHVNIECHICNNLFDICNEDFTIFFD